MAKRSIIKPAAHVNRKISLDTIFPLGHPASVGKFEAEENSSKPPPSAARDGPPTPPGSRPTGTPTPLPRERLVKASTYEFARFFASLGPRGDKRPGLVEECRPICDLLDDPYPFKAVFGPRGVIKTTILRAHAAKKFHADHDFSVLWGSHEIPLAIESVKVVSGHLTGRAPRGGIARYFGKVPLDPDRQEFFTVADHQYPLAMNSMNVFSPGRQQTGGRWKAIYLDNLQSEANTGKIELIEPVLEAFRGAIPLLSQADDRELVIMENIWHHADLGARLLGDYREEAMRTQQPMMVDGEFGPFKVLCIPAGVKRSRKALDYERLNFPFNLPMEELETRLALMGANKFAAQYDLEPVADEETIFHPDNYRTWEKVPDDVQAFIATDAAYRTKYHNDFSAFIVWGMGKDNIAYELDHFVGRVPIGEFVRRTLSAASAFNALKIGVEQTQLAVALEDELRRQMRLRGTFFSMTPLKHENKPKEDRAQGVKNRYDTGAILFHPEKSARGTEMYRQVIDFPRGRHDDLVDCVSYLPQLVFWRGAMEPLKKQGPAVDPYWERIWNELDSPQPSLYRTTEAQIGGWFED